MTQLGRFAPGHSNQEALRSLEISVTHGMVQAAINSETKTQGIHYG